MLGRSSLPVYFPSDSFWNWLMQMVERITFLLALLFIDFCSGLCLYRQGLYPHILKSLSFVMCPVAFCIACHSFSRYPLFTSSQIAPSWFSFDLTGCPYLFSGRLLSFFVFSDSREWCIFTVVVQWHSIIQFSHASGVQNETLWHLLSILLPSQVKKKSNKSVIDVFIAFLNTCCEIEICKSGNLHGSVVLLLRVCEANVVEKLSHMC